jgi:hypothetical protein
MVAQPTTAEKATIVAQCATAIMCAPDSLKIYAETNHKEETFRQWAISQALPMAKDIFSRLK